MSEAVAEPATPAEHSEDVQTLIAAIGDLKNAVGEMQAGRMDEAAVRAVAQQAIAASRQAGTDSPNGFVPDDVEQNLPTRGKLAQLHGVDRQSFILESDAARIAPMLRKSVDAVKHFQQTSDKLVLLAAMTKTKPEELNFYYDEFLPARQQAMDTKTVGEGKELLAPVAISADVIEQLAGQQLILNLFPTINMPTNPFEFVTKGPRRHVATLAEATAAGTPKAKLLLPGAPAKVQMTATKFAGEIITSKELEEEAAIALLPYLQEELLDWLGWDLEDATLNGDTANTMDAGVAADDPKTGWDGIRKLTPALAKVDAAGAALSVDMVAAARAKMGRYGLNPNDLVLLVAVPSLYSLIVDPKVATPDKYGAGATLISGELGRVWGIPILSTDIIRTDLNATGVYSVAGQTLTIAQIVHKQAFIHGVRRNTTVQILTELYAESDQDAVLMTTRQALMQRWAGTPATAQIFNVKTT